MARGRLAAFADGEYRFTLKIGDHDSEPVLITIQNGKPSAYEFQFRLPVTRLQALGEAP